MTSNTAARRDLRPKKSLGQHFLRDEKYLDIMLDAAEITPGDCVLEIGPGKGALTKALANRNANVVSIEIDERMTEYLRSEFADDDNVSIIEGDVLELDPAEVALSHCGQAVTTYKLAADLPYYITSAILRHVLEAELKPTIAAVMVQREVAERICAKPDNMSVLAVSVQYYAEPSLIEIIPASAFYPQPKVDSAILRLDILPQPAVGDVPTERFFTVVRAGFAQRRKQITNSLSASLGRPKDEVRETLVAHGIEPRRRAETFTLDEWRTICIALQDR